MGDAGISARRASMLGLAAVAADQDDGDAQRRTIPADEQEPSAVSVAKLRAFNAETTAAAAPAPAPVEKSMRKADLLWLGLGLVGAHRFYLGLPLSGALQASLFVGSWGAILLGFYQAFVGLVLSCCWTMADGFRIKRMHARSRTP